MSEKLIHILQPLFFILLLFSAVTAQTTVGKQPSDGQSAVPKVEFEKYALPNGLQVILHIDRKLPVVHVNQWFHIGSKNEKEGRTGFAHLFEHMMFQGSKNASGEYVSYVEKAGANLFTGGVDGTTDEDRTNYFATVPSTNLEFLLWLESDRLATLADALTKEKIDNQRDVVKNERRQGLENQPYGRAFSLISENLFPKGHPYSWPVIGSQEDLTAATLDDVRDFFKTYYTPNNLSLVIVSDFDPAEAKRLVEKYFAGIPPGPALARPSRWIPTLNGEKVVEVRDRVPQERVYMAWPSPRICDDGDADLEIASAVLADGLSSRLKKVLVYDQQLATDVSAFQNASEIAGFFGVIATARPGVKLSLIEQIVTDEIARLAINGPTPEELGRVKNKIEYQFVSGLERIGGFGGKADRLNRYPAFPEAEVTRERKTQLDRLGQEANNPNALSARIGNMLLFGREHPYGRSQTGLPGTVATITRDDIENFHKTYWKPGGSALIFAGDITLSEATELARQNFGSWSGGAPPVINIPAPQPVGEGKVFVVDKQDAAQTIVAQLFAAPTRQAEDYYAFNLADAVYGGGFKTRLNLNLREDKGYSYGVYSFPSFYAKSGAWIASGGVQTNKTKESIVEFNNELKNISSSPNFGRSGSR